MKYNNAEWKENYSDDLCVLSLHIPLCLLKMTFLLKPAKKSVNTRGKKLNFVFVLVFN